ncbi:MAG: hypothetical protein HC844_13025 [Tabrizicola sp.]|nr:hypothetical protein [Tabrizicola sp.]
MKTELLLLALAVGAANWAFRVLPVLMMRGRLRPGSLVERFLAATGPAAIATLFVAAVLPSLLPVPRDVVAMAAGTVTVVALFWMTRSVAAATLAGSMAFGAAVFLLS